MASGTEVALYRENWIKTPRINMFFVWFLYAIKNIEVERFTFIPRHGPKDLPL